MTTVPHSRLSNQRSNCERVSRARSMIFHCRSATATWKTFFATSTATVVAFILDSSCLVTLTHAHVSAWHNDAARTAGGVHPIIREGRLTAPFNLFVRFHMVSNNPNHIAYVRGCKLFKQGRFA